MPSRTRPPLLSEASFAQLRQRVEQATGALLADDRRAVVAARLHKRLKTHQLNDFDSYLALLDSPLGRQENEHLLRLLVARDSYFFREHRHFECLARWLPALDRPARLWSAACATGEEAWSLAMVAAEHARQDDWQVLASDFDPQVLEQAASGIYDIAQARYFPEGWLARHCLCGVGEMVGRLRIAPSLRKQVRFEAINLIQPLPEGLGRFDAILLRNLLSGLAPRHKDGMLRRLLTHLRPGGLLLIGHSENLHGLELPLRPRLPSVFERL
ncbi:MAG: SAM-dependent methyltransferase [Paucimonas sp.]|jgi:chemotaxis protein methyltransferase CheR|uniref:CheR family methyltransferase n=1 Tax=Pantoea sp. Cy-639 TaxID=2608360 RepID=UPI0014200C58|nr:CheR family methyltransferase [Pantoea sp. Cy-639]MDR2308793.1 SAM-dependent methyltransferase [Paucimonas sp.]NIF17250.1 protein-glutamate O-methyltransferase [Pantoea sp. Cy-639]